MIRFIYIFIFSALGLASHGQKTKLLKAVDFQNQQLDEQWIYVKFKNGSTPNQARSQRLTDSKNESIHFDIFKLKVPQGRNPIDYCNELRRSKPDLIYADPIVQYLPLASPSDALIGNQFYLDNIKVHEAWEITKGDDDITIGIIDTGIDLDHEDMVANLWLNTDDPVDGVDNDENGYIDDYLGYDFADIDTDPSIQNGNHGMIVAGIAGAATNNGKGIAGVGYNTKVAALKGFKSSNGKSGGLYEAIIYAAENGFDVVNLSWGRMGAPLQSEQDIINYAVLDHDMVVVAAAGNEGGKATEQNKWYPASYENVLSVAASDATDNKSSGSSFNRSVDIAAPGVSMFSTVNNNGYSNGGPGTSFASPQVAASAALVKDQFPNLSAVQIMERLRVTADDIYDIGNNSIYEGKLGKGRLNVLRAVSETNVRSLRAENPTLTSAFGDNVFFGDTVRVSAILTNHLSAINDPSVTISSPGDNFTISEGSFLPGFMSSQDSRQISFNVILNEDIQPETDIEIRLDYAATGYTDFQFLEVTTSPDYADFGNDKLSMTIGGDGDLGFNTYGSDPEGSGFIYQLDTLMTYTGLLLASNASSVSSNIISNYPNQTRNEDFTVQQFYKLYHHSAADHFGYSEFIDQNKPLIVEQSNITWDNEDYIIIRYRIINNSAAALNNLSVGIFADWDLADKYTNYAEYDLSNNYMFARNGSSDLYGGVQVLGGNGVEFSALDMAGLNGNSQDINDVFSDSEKYEFLVNQEIATAGSLGSGNDIATMNGVTINQMDAYSEEFVNVIFAVSDSKDNLDAAFIDAQVRLDEFLLKPRVLETLSVCDGASISIDPSDGLMYEFYEDPLAQDLITTASSYDPGTITKDTVFYLKNVDNNYPSDIFEFRISLFNDIADFQMSTDTLYLDNSTNVVQFSDQSLDATSWSWDFGEGTSATIQNPSLSFATPGTYPITLEVGNALGCIDIVTKNLVVANRPSPPTFGDLTICPGEEVTINEPSAEKIHVYVHESSSSPTLSGNNISITSITQDTTLYISGVYGSFESERTPLNIDVLEVQGRMFYRPDTLSENHQIVISIMDMEVGSTLEWNVGGLPAGSEEEIIIPALAGTVDVVVEIISPAACNKTLEEEILISTSPFAFQTDLLSCANEFVDIRPENGTYFGFYEDAELTTLISKGTHLQTNTHNKIYVVNLDDGLPGMPIEVNISNKVVAFDISHIVTAIGQKNQVDLSIITDEELTSFSWYINGDLSETSQSPTFFLDPAEYEIVLVVSDVNGCQASDTLLLDFVPPLAITDDRNFVIYPNPSNGIINIESNEIVERLQLLSLDGKVLLDFKKPEKTLDLSELPSGHYIIKAEGGDDTWERQLRIYDH
ncbi:MAG: S8 family serine peptidase [Ekhidna sp.]